MIPRLLSEWSVDVIRTLLAAGIHESEEFDFKEMLPHTKDEDGKRRLRDACCAFANSNGGFLVFGVADDRTKLQEARIVGIVRSDDFPASFGNFPKTCSPSVHWTFLNSPLPIASGRVVHVVHIPQSWRAPHASGSVDDGWRFSKRTNKGSEGMSIDEIRATYLGFYEKRLRLQLLSSELASLEDSARQAIIDDPDTIENQYSLVTFEMQTIQAVVSDTYPLTAGHSTLLSTLTKLRRAVVVANNKASIFFSTASLAFASKNQMIRDHNEFMAQRCKEIARLANEARVLLAPILAP